MRTRARKLLLSLESPASTPGPLARYGVAVLAVLAALGARLALEPLLGAQVPYLIFTLGVLVAAGFGGRLAGLAATVLSMVVVAWFLLKLPEISVTVHPAATVGAIVLFAVVGCLISELTGRAREWHISVAQAAESLRRQADLINLSHDAIITTDSERRILSWNAGAGEMYGWTEREAVGKRVDEFLGTSGDTSTAQIDEILRRERQWDGELSHSARDGHQLFAHSRQVLVRDEENRPARILEINRDITESKRAQDAVRASDAQFRTLANGIPQLCWMANADGSVFWYNQRWYEYTGSTPEQMEGWGWQSVHKPEMLPKVLERWSASILSGEPFDMVLPLRGADGVYRPFLTRVVPVRDQHAKGARWFGTNTDISEQLKVEEIVRQASEQRRLALEAAKMGAWEYKLDTGEVIWDARYRAIIGIPAEGKVFYDEAIARIHPDDRKETEEAIQRALAGKNGGAYHREFRVVWPDGSLHSVESHGQAYFEGEADQRRAVRFLGAIMETTESKRGEARLRQSQKLESIGLLAGGVAHDFNNLLTVIMGNAGSAVSECPSCKYSQAVVTASERAAYLTKQLLAYAGKSQFVVRVFDLAEIVSKSRELLFASVPRRVRLSFNLANDLPMIEEDPINVEQILMNLVINAGEAILPRTDGQIEISTCAAEIDADTARRWSQTWDVVAGPYVCLQVKDNGSGIDESTLARIFDPFFTTKFTGRGLGLAAVHGIVRSSKGFIEVLSPPGCGTTFRVFLPASQKQGSTQVSLELTPSVKHNELRGLATILVVDDEEMVRKLTCFTLLHYGYDVLEAKDGRDALRVLADCSALPALVFLDLAMPVLGGDELVPILRKQYPGLKIVMTSGFTEDDARDGLASDNVVGFLQKPYSPAALVQMAEQALGTSSAQGSQILEFPRTA